MSVLWSALLLIASQPTLSVEADPDVPVWITQHWENHGPRLVAAYENMSGANGIGNITLTGTYEALDDQVLGLSGHANPGAIHIHVAGESWELPSMASRHLVLRNLSHELAHIWQRATYDSLVEPRWLHEGFAQALSMAALERSDLWTSQEILAFRKEMDERCAAVMAEGPILAALEKNNRDAVYACSFILVDAAANIAGKPPAILYADYVAGMKSGKGFARTVEDEVARGYLGRARRFVYVDYTHTQPEAVIAALRSGRL